VRRRLAHLPEPFPADTPFLREYVDGVGRGAIGASARWACWVSVSGVPEMVTHLRDTVVLINQVTTKITEKGTKSFLAPALGDTWAHACTSRVMLYWDQGQRYASLYKSPSRKSNTVAYCVTAEGVSVASPVSFSLFLPDPPPPTHPSLYSAGLAHRCCRHEHNRTVTIDGVSVYEH